MTAASSLRRILAALVGTLLFAPAPAEAATWSRALGTTGDELSVASAVASDGAAYALARSLDLTGPDRYALARFDPDGRLEWARAVGDLHPSGSASPALAATDGGGCVVAFGRSDGIAVVAFDALGSPTWQQRLGSEFISELVMASVPSSGDVILVAHVPNPAPPFWGSWVIRLDRDGLVEWQWNHFDPNLGMKAHWVTATRDGGALVVGDLMLVDNESFVMKLDASGAVAWTRELQDFGQSIATMTGVELPNGSFLVAGSKATGPWAGSIDASGGPEWLFGPTGMASFLPPRAAVLPGGLALLAFTLRSPVTNANACELVALDPTGAVQWQRVLEVPDQLDGMDVAADGVLLTGRGFGRGPGGSDALVVRTALNGTLPAACSTPDPSEWPWSDTNLSLGPWTTTSQPRPVTSTPLALSFPDSTWVAVDACGCVPDPFEQDDACAAAGDLPLLAPGATEFHEGCDDPVDWMTFDACAGETYVLATSALAAGADTVLSVLADDCATVLASDDDGGGGRASRIDFVAPADGTYRLRIENALGTGTDSGYAVSLAAPCTSSSWLRTLETPAADRLTSVVALASGGFAAAGEIEVGGVSVPWILVLAEDGTTRQLALAGAGSAFMPQVAELADGDLLVMGGRQLDPSSPVLSAFALRVDPATGAVRWHVVLSAPASQYFVDGVERSDGSLLLVGSMSAGGADVLLVELDATGGVLRQRSLGTPGSEYAAGVALLPAGEALVVASGFTPATWFTGLLVALDDAGDISWQRAYDATPAALGLSFSEAVVDPSGGIVVAAAALESPTYDAAPALLRVDPSGGAPSLVQLGPEFDAVAHVAVRRDGSVVVAGDCRSSDSYGDAWIAAVDATDALSWQVAIGRPQLTDSAWGLALSADGGPLLVGEFQAIGGGSPDGLMAWLRPDGSVAPGACGPMRATASSTTPLACATSDPGLALTALSLPALAPAITPAASWTVVREHCAGFEARAVPPPDEVSPSGSAEPLVFTSRADLRWERGAASRATAFNLYRGDVASLRGRDFGACLIASVPIETASDPELPGVDAAWFYLVTGRNAAGEGPMGFDSLGAMRVNGAPCP